MSKHNFFADFFKKTSLSINSLLEKKLNKLNFIFKKKKFLILIRSNKVFGTLATLIFLFFSYLSIPYFYNSDNLTDNIKNQLSRKLNINFSLPNNYHYNLFPKPNFTFQDIKLLNQDNKLASIEDMKIYISFSKLFSLKKIQIKSIILNKVNFDLDKRNYNFFTEFLNNDFSNLDFQVNDSNIFYRNIKNDVLFINKINHLKYYFDFKDNKNILLANNSIFNLPYNVEIKDYKNEKEIFQKVNFDFLKLQVENVLDYKDIEKKGIINFTYNKKKSEAKYKIKKNIFDFSYFDTSSDIDFEYEGKINFVPFFLEISGDMSRIKLDQLFNPQNFFVQLLKTQLLNNKNININTSFNAKKIMPFKDLVNLELNFKIDKGMFDINETTFSWYNYVDFKISNSLIYMKNDELVLDGNMTIDINDFNEIYKFLQTPRDYRKEINKMELNFVYNFDQKMTTLNNIKIDGDINNDVNKILDQYISRDTILQNRIYFKSLINRAIKSYAG
jgi:hypothetical protein